METKQTTSKQVLLTLSINIPGTKRNSYHLFENSVITKE